MLDSDLAELYGVPTKRLNEAVKRNEDRFPADFMFQLTAAKIEILRSQTATSKSGGGGRRYLPYRPVDLLITESALLHPLSPALPVFLSLGWYHFRVAVPIPAKAKMGFRQ